MDTIKDNNNETVHNDEEEIVLKKVMGIPAGIAFVAGSVIGSGIFVSPTFIMDLTGSVGMALLIWLAGGIFSIVGALTYCELGTMIPLAGGDYAYFYKAFGRLPAFMFAWTYSLILSPGGFALVSLVFAAYILEPFFPGCAGNKVHLTKLIAAILIGTITIVNCASARWGTRVSIVFLIAKLGAIFILIVTGMVRLAYGHTYAFENSFENSTTDPAKVALSFYFCLFAYGGWNNLNYNTEEIINVKRTLPLSIIFGVSLVIICYLLVNVAYLASLDIGQLSTSTAVAVDVGRNLYGPMAWIMPVLVACSTFGSANGGAFSAGRVIFAAARDGNLPHVLAMIHTQRRTPIVALLFQSTIALIMLLPDSSSFGTLMGYFSFVSWLTFGLVTLSLLWMRYKFPDLKRPIKVWIGFPIITLLFSVYLIIAPFIDKPLEHSLTALFVLASVPIYLVFIHYELTPNWMLDGYHRFVLVVQKILDVKWPQKEEEIVM